MTNATSTKRVADAPWLGEIPVHWDVKPLFTVLRETDDRNTGLMEENLLSLSYGRIIRKDIDTVDGLLPESFDTYQIVEPDDIVLRLTDLQNDQRSLRVGLVPERGIITSAYVNLRAIGNHDPRFLFYQLHNADLRKVFYNFGGGVRQSMKYHDLKWLPILLPPIAQQLALVDFLDRETARIDDLAAKNQRLLELVDEQREAVISTAVTRGTSCNTALEETGYEWLGSFPKHWSMKRLKHVAQLIDGDRSSAYPTEEDYTSVGVPFLSSKDIIDFRLSTANLRFISKDKFDSLSRGKTRHADLVMTVRGTIGHVAVFDAEGCGFDTAFINAQMIIIRPSSISPYFLHAVTQSTYWQKQLEIASYGTAQQQLSNEVLSNAILVVPPKDEMTEITSFLHIELEKIDALKHHIRDAIDLLKEHRSTLISKVITGQIDVRDIRQQEAAAGCQ